MTNSERRDTFAAGIGAIEAGQAPSDRAELVDEHVRQRLADAEACLVRLRNEANSRRGRAGEEALVKLLDDVGSPLAYLTGFVEETTRQRQKN